MDASYYSMVERTEDGRFIAWVPDLPGLSVTGDSEEEVVRALSQTIRQCVRTLIIEGKPVPPARSIDELPIDVPPGTLRRRLHRTLLIIG